MGRLILMLGLLLGPLVVSMPQHAAAAGTEGRWSVLIVTDSGSCDRAYRYEVAVKSGKVSYVGEGSFNITGTVSSGGAVRVGIRKGSQHAEGTGRLSGNSGGGKWRGQSSSGACAGHWEAERR